jgi:hypothetical protein
MRILPRVLPSIVNTTNCEVVGQGRLSLTKSTRSGLIGRVLSDFVLPRKQRGLFGRELRQTARGGTLAIFRGPGNC